jgi:hypothetical protein
MDAYVFDEALLSEGYAAQQQGDYADAEQLERRAAKAAV